MEKYEPMPENINIEELQEYIGKWLDYHIRTGKRFGERTLLHVIAKQRTAIKAQMDIINTSDCVSRGAITIERSMAKLAIKLFKKTGVSTYIDWSRIIENKLKEYE